VKRMPIRIVSRLGVVLVLAVMTAGVAAASASAVLPKYVLTRADRIAPNGIAMTIETPTPAKEELFQVGNVTCSTTLGEIEGEGLQSVKFTGHLTFTGCKGTSKGAGSCHSVGAGFGDITTNNMTMYLVYLSKATKEVGLVLNYTKTGEAATLESFECEVTGIWQKITVRGTALAKMTPINQKTSKFTVALTGSKGVPTLTKYENEKGEKFTTKLETQRGTGAWEGSDLNSAGLSFQLSEAVAEIQA
jgi:hypothetical protein